MKEKSNKKRASSPNRVLVRQLKLEDYPAVCDLQLRCFPGMKPWLLDQMKSQLEIFPEGQICIEINGKLVASSASLMVNFDLHSDWHNWGEISDNGYIRSHDPAGDALYGIEIMVDPDHRGYRLSRRLYDARKQLAREKNLTRIIIGGRIPGYHKYAEEMTAREYVDRVIAKELYDQVLTAQLANGFELSRLIPDYLPVDKESMGYATHLEWTNFDYRPGGARHFRAVDLVRVAAVQYEMRAIASFEDFARQCEYFVDAAGESRADFVVFPELVANQLLSLESARRPGLAVRQLAAYAERYVELFARLAIKYNVNIVGGSHFVLEEGKLYNVAHLFHRDGQLSRQPKLHVSPSERRWWGVSPGAGLEVFDTDRGKVAILMSYDIQFPELARIAARRGAHILFVPFDAEDREAYVRDRACAHARCIENHVYVVLAGSTGNLPFVANADTHYAQSAILTPSDISFSRDGIAAECTPNAETVLVHDLDIEILRRHRYGGATQNWNDRRRDLYQLRYVDGGGSKDV